MAVITELRNYGITSFVLLLTLTACAAQPSSVPLPVPAEACAVCEKPDDSALKSARAANAALRGELERCRRRLDELGKQLTAARVKVMGLLHEVEGLRDTKP